MVKMEKKAIANYFKLCIICICLTTLAMATIEDDEKDCADQLGNLASCMPYVSGSAKMPTPECCQDTIKVRSAKPKCLCVLIKESTDPSMGLPINTTLALQMPTLCKIDAKVSDCPAILKLPANSADAKIFQVANAGSSNTPSASTDATPASSSTSTSSTSPSSSSSSSASSSSDTKKTTASSSSSSSFGGMKLAQSIVTIIALVLLI
ncbi:OLC1v1037232C1 [Oldenlandia corymbosa var. corymbosa]|uniref:OLC1v1037232C1 n=1 Tax=Oldenlandia corymbosa var. corymbosa TaxID=529605 RepID=A0AAV1CYC7_OLDCO|nr:OLC1v1037232C1 [Oldenlandia corymbosa var. corymbosa]